MDQVAQELRDSYKPLDPIWISDTPKFVQMMILDGCFILEILRANDGILDDYAENDPVFGEHGKFYVLPYIKRDMLMLENQIPMMVLYILIKVETGIEQAGEEIIRSAVELHEAGIRFKKSKTWSLKDVSFDRGVLRLPTLVVDDTTEYMLLNLIALERLHVGAGNEVTSFIFFMDTIIDSDMDVALLNRSGIIINALGSDKVVSKLFNSLSKDITVDRHGILDVENPKISQQNGKDYALFANQM
ncbi:hypothetical protein TSUD_250060 [Trifolium subterraneum]|nr:hypothetical protein TSUD_250060 [Trifolium subterraneum]